tara:strand:+ start:27009 stop:28082 length:1074 start_codon:yes stop_codon:yes gene_type:complete
MKKLLQKNLLLILLLTVAFSACKSTGSDDPALVETVVASDIAANVNTTFTPPAPDEDVQGDTESSPGYTFYDLETGSTISDSLSPDWDIAFGGTTILANSGNGGGIILMDQAFANVETAPDNGFEASNDSWYTYTGEAPSGPKHAILANQDQTLIIRTSDDKYAKIQIISYYEGNPDTDSEEFANFMTRPASNYFTFNYTIQNDGSTNLFHQDSYTFFDLDTGELVVDSLSSQWDLGFNGTTIIANTGQNGGVQSLNISFSELDEAPIAGYIESNTSWYTYTGEAPSGPKHAVLANEGQSLVVLTPDGKYAKVRIISYYQGNPDVTSDAFISIFTRPEERYYTFEYAVQTDGSRFFE